MPSQTPGDGVQVKRRPKGLTAPNPLESASTMLDQFVVKPGATEDEGGQSNVVINADGTMTALGGDGAEIL